MSADWPVVRLGDFCIKVGSGSTPNGGANVYLEQGEICLIRSQNVHNDGFKSNGLVYITQESADKLKNVVVEENDILLNITGDSVARVCLAKNEYLPARVNQHVAIIRPDPEKFDSRYLRYLLVSPTMQNLLLSIASIGATRNALTKGMIESLEVCKPSISIQKSIASSLEALDLKRELNTQTNQTLEAIAQAIFKSWFVDFEPVKAKMAVLEAGGTAEEAERTAMCAISGKDEAALIQLQTEQPDAYAELAQTATLFPSAMQDSELGEIPEGWEAKALGHFLEIKRGGSPRPIQDFIVPKGYPWVKIADATADKSPFLFETKEFIKEEGLKKTVYLKKGALILTNSATPGLPKFLELDACIHDGWLYFPEKKFFSDAYLYFLFLKIRVELVAQGNGSVFTNLKTDILRNQLVLVPCPKLIEIFTKSVSSILENMKSNCTNSHILSNLRDNLLPKLLSGEIDLSVAADVDDEVSV
jgi:type I restriction enzyme S subunit